MIQFICYIVTFLACILGTICGMGGGIIIKPVLDSTGIMAVSTITFLSGCTVIAMTGWNVFTVIRKKESVLEYKTTTILAISSAVGGLIGKQLYVMVAARFSNPNTAGGVQAAFLFLATLLTFIYTLRKDRIQSKQVTNIGAMITIGFFLGVLGSFLGIGGGPFNVAMLCYFFSMATKTATQNSLYIILFSQLASTGKSLVSNGFPAVSITILIGMIILAIVGSTAGRKINKKLDDKKATYLFEFSMILIMVINIYNIYKYLIL